MREMGRPDEPAYAGGATFSKVPLVLDPAELTGHDVAIVSAPNMDAGVDPFEALSIVDHGDASIVPADAARSHEAIRRAVGAVAAAGLVPIVLGGDHSIAHPDVGAVAEARRP